MQMPLYRDEIAGEVHDFFRQIPIYQEQPTSPPGDWPHLAQTWPGMNSQDDGTQLGCNMPYMSEASNPSDWIGNRSGNTESSRHLSSESHPLLGSQPANDNTSRRMTQLFLSAGQQSMESQNFIHRKASNLQNGQSTLFPTVIRSQPRNQPLDFEGLFAGSTNQFETGNSFSVGRERLDESNCAGQSVLYNQELASQNHEIMRQEQPSQNYDRLAGQIPPLANIQGGFGQQPGMDASQILYQQYIQEMHRQQQMLQLQQHFQLSRQQQLQWLLAAQNQGFGTQVLQDQDLLKARAERLPFSFQPHFYLPQNLSGNVHWPLVSSSLRPAEVNNHPLGPGISVQQQLAPKAPTMNPSLLNCASNNRRGDGSVVPENSLLNARVSNGTDYHFGGLEKDTIGRNPGPPTFPGVSVDRNSSYNNLQTDKLQQFNKFPFVQNIQEACSESVAKNMNSYYEGGFQSSAQLNYSAGQQQNWSGISDHDEDAQVAFCPQSSIPGSNAEQQEIFETVKSPQEATELLFRNQSVGIHQHLQQGNSLSTQAEALNKVRTEQGDVLRGAQGMQPQSPVNNKTMNFAHVEAQSNWSKLHLQNTQFQFENLHQSGPNIQQSVWNDLSLHNGGSPLPGNTLHLFTDFESVENRLPQERSSLQTERSFLALAGSAERLHGDWKTHALQQGNFHPGNSLQALLELDDDIDEDMSNQQVLQEALQIDGPFQSSEMEWQHEIHAGDQSLQHDGLHNRVTFTSDQSMSRNPEGNRGSVIENKQLCNVLASHIQNNEDRFTSANISQRHAEGLKECAQIFQGTNGMLDETFKLPRDVVSKEITGQLDGHVWEHDSLMGTNHEAFGVDVRSKEMMQSTHNNALASNSEFVAQELASNLWASQQARSMQEFGTQSWRIPSSNVIDKTYVMNQTNNSMLSTMGHQSNEINLPQPNLQGDKEKLTNMNYSLLKNLQKEKYSASILESNAKLQSRLQSTNLSGLLEGSIPPRSSLLSNNLISGWYNAEDAPTENTNLNELIQSQTKVQQLPAQQNGQLSFTGKQMDLAFSPSTNKEVTSSVRTERTPEANYFGNDPNGTLSPADSLRCEGSQHATSFSSYSSASRNTLQLLNKHEMPEGAAPEVKQLLSTSALQTESGSIGHFVPLSESFQRQPISPQHCGLRLGPPSHTNSLTKNGRSSFMFWHADAEKVWLGNESQGHGLPVPLQIRASENGEMRLAQKNLSAESSAQDSTLVFHPTSGPPLQSPMVANDTQNRGIPSSTYSVQFTSASATHPLPQVSSANHVSSFNFTSERRLADESIFLDRVAASSSSLESNPMPSSAALSVASQELVLEKKKDVDTGPILKPRLWNDTSSLPCPQKSYLQASFPAPLPRQVAKSQLNLLQEISNQLAPKIDSLKNVESSIRLDLKRNSLAHPTLVGHPSRLDRKSKDNMSSDFKDEDSTRTVAQVKALEEVTLPALQGHSRVSAMQGNNSSVYFRTDILQSKLQAIVNSQTENSIQRPSHVGQKQQSGVSGNLDKERSLESGTLEGQYSVLNNSNEHASFQFGHEVPDSRPQVTPTAEMIKSVTPSSRMPSSQRPLPGSTVFSDQHLGTDTPFHKKVGSRANSHLLSYSLPKDLHESAQGYSQRNVHSEGVLPSGYSEKCQTSNLIKQQTRVPSSSSLAGPKHFAEQSGFMLQPSENVHHHLSSCMKRPNTNADEPVNTVEPTTHLQGSPSKPAKTISSLPMKRRKECLPLMPWHMAVNQSAASLPRTSGAELQWAAAVNRLPEKGDEGVDLSDASVQFSYRAKQRLRLTTQLMQMIIPPAPAALMRSTTAEGRDSGTFTFTKVLLGEACSLLAGSGSTQHESTSKKDGCSGCTVIDLASKQQKLFVGTKFRAEAAAKDMVEFKERANRLEDCLSRLESLPSALEIKTEGQHLDKLCITNRLVDRHFDDFALEEMDFPSGGRATSAVSQATCKVFPRRYVRAVPMPNRLPEETHLVSL